MTLQMDAQKDRQAGGLKELRGEFKGPSGRAGDPNKELIF